jgi:hypothetical protein
MKLLRAMAVTGLAVTLTFIGQNAFAQSDTQQYGPAQETQAKGEATYNAETSNWGNTNEQSYNQGNVGTNQSGWSQAREVKREINEARSQGIDVSDAEYYENRGRQELNNGNFHRARLEFNKAETALDNAGFQGATAMNQENYNQENYTSNSGDNWEHYNQGNTGSNTSGWTEARQIRRDIGQAQSEGIDVSDAQYYANRGREALQNGNQAQARNYFNKARNSLSASGYSMAENASQGSNWENYNTENSNSGNYNQGSYSENTGNQASWSQERQVKREINDARAQGLDVSDAQYFARRGRQALQNGNRDQAETYFDQAETALQDAGFQTNQASNSNNYNENYGQRTNENYGQGNYNQGNYNEDSQRINRGANEESSYNQTNYSGNQNGWSESHRVHHEIDQAQAQGINVNDAIYYETQGNDALRNGDATTARNDFNMAENALSQAGFQPGQANNQQAYNQMGR